MSDVQTLVFALGSPHVRRAETELKPDAAVMWPVDLLEELRQMVRSVLLKYAHHKQVRATSDTEMGCSAELWLAYTESHR